MTISVFQLLFLAVYFFYVKDGVLLEFTLCKSSAHTSNIQLEDYKSGRISMLRVKGKKSVIKKCTILLAAAMVINPFASIIGLTSGTAQAAESNPIVISKIFGGGSQNADALYKYDFIELYNPADTAVDVTGWSVQYAVSTSKADSSSWQVTPLTGTIPARGFYLIQEAGKAVLQGPDLPPSDAQGLIDLDNKDGKVALVSSTTALNTVNPIKPDVDGSLVDFVGYGAAQSYYGSGPAPTPSAQKAIVRKAEDPEQGIGVVSKLGSPQELFGNGWNSQQNNNDFDVAVLGTFLPRNAAFLTPLSVKADSENNSLKMGSTREISAPDSDFAVTMTTGLVKEGELNAADYEVIGLPDGFSVIRAIGDSLHKKIIFTIGGTAASDILSDVQLSAVINKSAVTTGAYDHSQTVSGITLLADTPKVKGTIVSNKLFTTAPSAVAGSFSIHVTTGSVKEGPLADKDYQITGLPSGLTIQAIGDKATNQVIFTISGTAIAPMLDASPLSITLKASAVVSGASLDSDLIEGITLDRYRTPLQFDVARKKTVTQRIKEANDYFNDPVNKSYKYGADGMANSVAAFYRGSAYMFYQDLGSVIPLPDSWKKLNNVKTWIEGDAHLANVGYYDDKFGNIIFDLNDFDGAYIAPFYLDLLRMTSSLYLTRDSEKLSVSDAEMREIAKNMLDEYMVSLQSLIGNNNKNTAATKLDSNSVKDGFTKTLMTKLAKKTQLDHLIKWTVPTADGKHSTGELNVAGKGDKYREPTATEIAEVEQNWQKYVSSLSTDFSSAKLAENADYFAIKDIAVRIYQGLGSIGSQRYNVLIEGPTASHDDDFILDVKQAFKPDMFENAAEAQTTPYDTFTGGNGAKVKTAYEKMSLDAEPFLGYFDSGTRDFFVHKISLYKGDYEDAPGGVFKTKDNLVDYVSYISKLYAYGHARSAESSDDTFEKSVIEQLYTDSKVWNEFQTTLVNLGEDYYRQVKADYAMMEQDLINGNLIDVSVLKGMTLNEGSLSPQFDENKLTYTASVKSDVASIQLTAASLDSKATIKIKGQTYTSGTPITVELSTGANAIDVVVTAQDGITNKTYSITVTRQESTSGGNNGGSGESNPDPGTGTPSKPDVEDPKKNMMVIDTEKLNAALSALQASQQSLVFEAPKGDASEISLQLPLAVLEQASKTKPNLMLTFKTGIASYTLPIGAIDFNLLAKELGSASAGITSTLTILVNKVTGENEKTIQASLKAAGLNAISIPVEFRVIAEADGKKKEISDFGNQYVSRVIPYESNTSTNESVVIRLNGDGTLAAMPVTFLNGNATIYSQSNSVYVVAHGEPLTFADISMHWAKSEIELLATKRIIQGISAQAFAPDKAMTRAEFTVLLAKAFAFKDNGTSASFSDVADTAWYAGAVGAAHKAGIINGFPDGSFQPNQAITREQMAVMIVKAAELSGKSLSTSSHSNVNGGFKDANLISQYAQTSVELCRQSGIIKGNTNGTFSPAAAVTRAQAAVMFKQLLQAISFIN